MAERLATPRLAVLAFTDVVKSVDLKSRLGDVAAAELMQRHDRIVRDLAGSLPDVQVLQDTGDGFLLRFANASDAVGFALRLQYAIAHEPWGREPIRLRIGINLGEAWEVQSLEEGFAKLSGLAVDMTARIMSVGQAGQVLLTRAIFDSARQNVRQHPPVGQANPPMLRWMAHGAYLFSGTDEPMEVFEVGAEGIGLLCKPPDTPKARRAVAAGEEATLGWRPAIGLEVPGRNSWALDRKLGEGGFGEVWLAVHRKLSLQRVFKFCFDANHLHSLKREMVLFSLLRDALGDRPDIARLREVNLEDSPFFLVSDYTPGGDLNDWARAQGGIGTIALARRIELVAQIADAVAAAHSVGVLHKDIKPANILIYEAEDGSPRPRLSDFGIGMIDNRPGLEGRSAEMAGFTQVAENDYSRTGTRMYSPPESLAGRPFTLQGDIYALGVLLYQMAIGDLERPLASGWERDISDPLLRQDIADCVDGDPQRRLPSATDLSRRLRTLEQRRTKGRQTENEQRRGKRMRRLLRVGAALSVAGAVLFALVLISLLIVRNSRNVAIAALGNEAQAKNRAEIAAQDALAARNVALHLAQSNSKLADDYKAAADDARRRLFELYDHEGTIAVDDGSPARALLWYSKALDLPGATLKRDANVRIRFASTLAIVPHMVELFCAVQGRIVAVNADGTRVVTVYHDQARVWDATTGKPITAPLMHGAPVVAAALSMDGARLLSRTREAALVWDVATSKALSPPLQHEGVLETAAFSPDGTKVVTASADKTVRVWDAATGKAVSPPIRHHLFVGSASFSPDGTKVVTASVDKIARVWDAATGKAVTPPMQHEMPVLLASFSPDGTKVVTRTVRAARVWDAVTGKAIAGPISSEGDLSCVAFSPDGTRLVTASHDNTARIWDAATGKPIGEPLAHENWVNCAAFSPDGRKVVTASRDNTVRVWDAASGKPLPPMLPHRSGVWFAAFSPDGTRIVTAGDDRTMHVWDASGQRTLYPPLQHAGQVDSASFSSDGKKVLTASSDHTARVWDAATGKPLTPPLEHAAELTHAVFSPDGTKVLTASRDKTARIWDAATGKPLTVPLQHGGWVRWAAFSPDGLKVVTGSNDKTAQIWDALTGKPLSAPLRHGADVAAVIFSADGKKVATSSADRFARIWDATSGEALTPPLQHENFVRPPAFSPDGKKFLTVIHNGVKIWDTARGSGIAPPLKHTALIHAAAFSSDSTKVLTASSDETARVWSAATGEALTPPMQHEGEVVFAAFSPDGTKVVTASQDETARVWDANTGKPITATLRHRAGLRRAIFSPDGTKILTTSNDRSARVWSAVSGRALTPPLQHNGDILSANFSPDGTKVVTASTDGTAQIWDISPDPRPRDDLRKLAEVLNGLKIDASDGLVPLDAVEWSACFQEMKAKFPGEFAPGRVGAR